ncbi:MAG TPA: glycoside hydrolase family 97 C-terminal domain-containing protein, partial [Pyrinomonadaceae bacterium]|nr:glycoside hydrolase family 97 C-terminal domain-containing protein [Pyrinomonadaceae bacterium]
RVNLVNDKTGGTRTVLTFLAIMNGPSPRKIDIGLDFLGRGNRRAVLVRDDMSEPAAVKIEHTTANDKTALSIETRSGGGFIGMFG